MCMHAVICVRVCCKLHNGTSVGGKDDLAVNIILLPQSLCVYTSYACNHDCQYVNSYKKLY